MLRAVWSVSLSFAHCIFTLLSQTWDGRFLPPCNESANLRHLWPSDRKQYQSRFCSNQTGAAVPFCARPWGRPLHTPTPLLTWMHIVLERKSSVDKVTLHGGSRARRWIIGGQTGEDGRLMILTGTLWICAPTITTWSLWLDHRLLRFSVPSTRLHELSGVPQDKARWHDIHAFPGNKLI